MLKSSSIVHKFIATLMYFIRWQVTTISRVLWPITHLGWASLAGTNRTLSRRLWY